MNEPRAPDWWDGLSLWLTAFALIGLVLGIGFVFAHHRGFGLSAKPASVLAIAMVLGAFGLFMLGRWHARRRRRRG